MCHAGAEQLFVALITLTQVVSLPNLRIIDFGYGYTGRTHDSTAWQGTRMAQEHQTLLEDNEFIWADSAYTVCF